eukprot:c19784_g2_i2.p1 GENE.c19784_g2_i2~~c19784_g2_i2.p1  ORF type:complete len:518 (+),score=137.98 c19784_g2_i2:48-1601(+)
MTSQFSKYDRQLRIWGKAGQQALEQVNICLLGADALGAEVMKNLVLPGIGKFTVVDGKKVQYRDVGSNFFVLESDVGKSRAQCVAELLKELNPDDVGSSFVDEDPSQLISYRPEFFENFTMIIASQLRDSDCAKLSEICTRLAIPLVVVRVYGLYGYLAISSGNHTIVESKPDYALDDLRLAEPFDGLTAIASQIDLNLLDDTAHAHVPYPILLLKLLEQWKANHGGRAPESSEERQGFKSLVHDASRNIHDEVNFEEALKNVSKLYAKPTIRGPTRQVLNSALCDADNPTPFWRVSKAIRGFVSDMGTLPLSGHIPDMTSDSTSYITLQRAYQAKAEADFRNILDRVRSEQGGELVDLELVHSMCKHGNDLACVVYPPLRDATNVSGECARTIGAFLEDSTSVYHVLIAIWAAETFFATEGRLPGEREASEDETLLLKATCSDLLARLGLSTSLANTDVLGEMVRSGSSEIHTMASLMGGIASQEAIKLITHQFVPINNTFVYDGIRGSSVTVPLA